MTDADNEYDLVAVGIYRVRHDADFARSFLRAHGIEAMITADDLGGTHPILAATHGVRLLVKRGDERQAVELLTARSRRA